MLWGARRGPEGVVTESLTSLRYTVDRNHGFSIDVAVRGFCPAVEPGRWIHQEEPLETPGALPVLNDIVPKTLQPSV
jgi:hypothetical protein